jgi:hypothetical protein
MSNPGSSDKHFELAVSISVEALKALLLFDGGAAAALIALTDKISGAHNYETSILMFGSGALCTVAAFATGYFSQLYYANHVLHESNKQTAKAVSSHRLHCMFQTIAICFVIAGLAFGVAGMVLAFFAARG